MGSGKDIDEGVGADEPALDMIGGDDGGEGGERADVTDVKVAEGGIGLRGIMPPGIVSFGFECSVSEGAAGNKALDWLTILIASLAFLYACISARHAPETERIVDKKNMTIN